MNKKDNTRLGYKINRKKEALLFIQHKLKVTNPITRLRLYFEYLKQHFVTPAGRITFQVKGGSDFCSYTSSKIEDILKMISYQGLSQIERKAAQKLIEKNQQTSDLLHSDLLRQDEPLAKLHHSKWFHLNTHAVNLHVLDRPLSS